MEKPMGLLSFLDHLVCNVCSREDLKIAENCIMFITTDEKQKPSVGQFKILAGKEIDRDPVTNFVKTVSYLNHQTPESKGWSSVKPV